MFTDKVENDVLSTSGPTGAFKVKKRRKTTNMRWIFYKKIIAILLRL